MTNTDDVRATADVDRDRAVLADTDDAELLAATTDRATALCTTTASLGELFPTLAARHYLQMPSRLLPARMHKPFGRRTWADLMGMSPRELHDTPRFGTPVVGELLVKLRTETAVLEAGTPR